MLLPRNCSTISSIFAPPNVNLEFGIKWPPNHAHFCASQLRPRSPAQRGGSPESRVPYLSRAAAQNRGRLPGVHRICESISAARAPRCPPFAATLRIASPISSAQGPWDPSDLRVPYLPRVFYGAYRLFRPFRIARPISFAQGPWDPSDLRVPYLPRAFYGTQRLLRPFRFASLL